MEQGCEIEQNTTEGLRLSDIAEAANLRNISEATTYDCEYQEEK